MRVHAGRTIGLEERTARTRDSYAVEYSKKISYPLSGNPSEGGGATAGYSRFGRSSSNLNFRFLSVLSDTVVNGVSPWYLDIQSEYPL